jgi:hypothetical protein
MSDKHTPTPWKLIKGINQYDVNGSDNNLVMGQLFTQGVPPNIEDTAFIVRAVNSHEALLEIAKWVAAGHATCNDIVIKAQKAIAQAEERP